MPVSDVAPAPRYLSPKHAASYSGIALKTLEFYRRAGKGPPFIMVGRSVLYDIAVIDAYLAARQVNSTAQAADKQKAEGAA